MKPAWLRWAAGMLELAIRNGKVKENPARLVPHRLEENARIRFLSADEEASLRGAIEAKCPERIPEFDLALNTGLRLSEQYGLLWENVSLPRRSLTILRSKNGTMRHVPLNQAAVKALETLRNHYPMSELVCGGAREPRRWFEPVLKDAKVASFSWHCLRHTFASRLVMAINGDLGRPPGRAPLIAAAGSPPGEVALLAFDRETVRGVRRGRADSSLAAHEGRELRSPPSLDISSYPVLVRQLVLSFYQKSEHGDGRSPNS